MRLRVFILIASLALIAACHKPPPAAAEVPCEGKPDFTTELTRTPYVPPNDSLQAATPVEVRRNPFSPTNKFNYSLSDSSQTLLVIFDILGQPIDTFVNEWQPRGSYEIEWNPNSCVTTGVYFYRLTVGDTTITKKFVILR